MDEWQYKATMRPSHPRPHRRDDLVLLQARRDGIRPRRIRVPARVHDVAPVLAVGAERCPLLMYHL